MAIGNINAKRYFRGVQGDKSNQGELFGVKNMFALRTGNVCLTMDILKVISWAVQGHRIGLLCECLSLMKRKSFFTCYFITNHNAFEQKILSGIK